MGFKAHFTPAFLELIKLVLERLEFFVEQAALLTELFHVYFGLIFILQVKECECCAPVC